MLFSGALHITFPFPLQKMFYSKKCGAIKSVTIEKHRKKKTSFAKAKYALVEFAHKDSVEVGRGGGGGGGKGEGRGGEGRGGTGWDETGRENY